MKVTTSVPYKDWRAIAPAAAAAEAEGFEGLTCPELANDPFAPLAIAALATEKVQLATSVAISFPRSPMITAQQAWDINLHSRGRFVLGLGTQVRAHNERRFSVPWVHPAPRMVEYVQAIRAIHRCWEYGEKLDFQGKFYNFTLMTPEFSPKPCGLPMLPIMIAAVGPEMQKAAARHCDGVRLHGFATRKYVTDVVRPLLETELTKDKSKGDFANLILSLWEELGQFATNHLLDDLLQISSTYWILANCRTIAHNSYVI